jgi:hypothetical protein
MKSLRCKNTHYFRTGFTVCKSINQAKAMSYGAGQTAVIDQFPTAYRVFALEEGGQFGEVQPYRPEFQAQLDQLDEMADKLASQEAS